MELNLFNSNISSNNNTITLFEPDMTGYNYRSYIDMNKFLKQNNKILGFYTISYTPKQFTSSRFLANIEIIYGLIADGTQSTLIMLKSAVMNKYKLIRRFYPITFIENISTRSIDKFSESENEIEIYCDNNSLKLNAYLNTSENYKEISQLLCKRLTNKVHINTENLISSILVKA